MAIYVTIKHYRHLLEGRLVTVYTDHKPLIHAFKKDPLQSSPRQTRHLEYIGQFTTDIQHIEGKNNTVADALSRVEAIHTTVELETITHEQQSDTELEELLKSEGKLS